MLEDPRAKRTAIAAAIGAVVAIPLPFIGPILGGIVGAGIGYFTAPPAMRYAVEDIAIETRTPITRIGRIVAGRGVRALRADGSEWSAPTTGFVHFA